MVKDKKEKIDLLSSSHSSSTSSSYGCEIGDPSSSSSSLSSLPYSDVDDIVEKLNDDAQCRLRFVDAGEVDSLGEVDNGGMHWKEVEQRFDRIAFFASHGHDDHESVPTIDASHFGYCIGMQQSAQFADELVQVLKGRKNHTTRLTKRELHGYWRRLANPSHDSLIQILFDMCDKDMDGRITKEDLKQMIMLSSCTNKMGMKQEEAEHFGSMIMQEADTQQKGYIEVYELKDLLKTVLTKEYLSKEQKLTESSSSTTSTSNNHQDYMHRQQQHNNATIKSMPEILIRTYWRRAWVVTLWLVICISLFTWKFIQYKHRAAFQVMGYCLSTAKGAAETLKLNMALILLPVCRNLVTWLRRTPRVSNIVPFNDTINFHKLIAGGIVIGVILHGGTHLACDLPRITASNPLVFQRTFGSTFGNQQPSYLQVLCTTEVSTGIAMLILMSIAFSLATRMPRRQSPSLPQPIRSVTGYNTFWYSHHLLVVVYILLIIHSMFLFLVTSFAEKTTWMYLAIPMLLYSGERIYRSIRSEIHEVNVLQANMYPGKVLHLKLSKPTTFTYSSGMYTFIKCPQVSPLEWHPFSLTSGPNDNHLSIHVRTLGDWSYQIHNLFHEAMMSKSFDYPKVYIDGPYGAASQDHVKYEVVVLVGLGIGVTPFISVLKDIGDRLQKPPSNHVNDVDSIEGPLKAYLYWVTREHGSLGWFKDAMNEISQNNQKQKVIEMHNFLTSVYQSGDARSILLSIIQALYLVKSGLDVFSQTQAQTHFSRPNWFKIFSNLARRHTGLRIGVFYCGSMKLARELEGLCTKFSTKTTTRFVFHKENY
ncbi:respiratory burst oxidase homolog protein A isoform X2 [Spinacia oleracea]|uniref:Respiratory burst oxidase homolog protein A isoform X2 n=1 Tax=Spinacia oleracea TaxID=3562 RepID=A0A9R0IVJ5_SPIOL|nr:respiratory burst oxidase homolog protein A-like isoform X2 [Spinacia oleracea]